MRLLAGEMSRRPFRRLERVLAICLPLGALCCARAPSKHDFDERWSAAAASASAAPNTTAAGHGNTPAAGGWALGQEYPYRLTLTTAVAFGDQAPIVDFDLSGDLLVIPASVAGNQVTLFVALRNAKAVSRAPDPNGQIAKVAEQASATGCLLGLVNGRVSDIRLASDLSQLTVGIYRDLGARLQFAPGSDSAPTYQVDEYDAAGKYTAEYSRGDTPGQYHKRKLRYAGVLGADRTVSGPALDAPGKIVPYVAASEGTITLSPDGRPTQIREHDEITITGAQTPVRSKTTVVLSAGAAVPGQPHDFGTMASHLTRLAADEPYAAKTPVAALDAARIHGLTYDKVVQRLSELKQAHPEILEGPSAAASGRAQSQPFMQELSSLFMALAAIFRQQPDTIARAMAAIRAHSPISEPLVDALGSSGSSDAHSALAELARAPNIEPKLKNRALTALVRTPNPSAESIAALEARLTDKPFDSTALYGLGTYARRLRDAGDTARAATIATLLQDRLRQAGKVNPRVETALAAITNCGCDQVLPDVTPFLTDKSDSVRAIAVRALQSMRDPQVDTLIAARMAGDPASQVKIAAMDAAGVRKPADLIVRSLSTVARTDPDPRVRYRGVELLIDWLPQRNDLRSTLQEIAAKDPEAQVRSRAKAAL
jgi:hypothetical protein